MAATTKATGSTFLDPLRDASESGLQLRGSNGSVRRHAKQIVAAAVLGWVMGGGAWAADEPAAAKPDPAKAQKIVTEVCAACHGADGNSTSPANPKLAGQHPEYLYKQLQNFKGHDGKPAERNNAVMTGMVTALSDADMQNLAAYYAGQKLKPSVARIKESVELGQQIFRGGIAAKNVPACSGCHGPNGAGMPAQYPHLSGQYADYTAEQLTQFRAGKRGNNAPMMTIAARLSDAEIKAVSDYIAGLR